MNSAVAFILAAFVYPGLLAALVAAWALGWARSLAGALTQGRSAPGPLSDAAEIAGSFTRETYAPEGVSFFALSLGTTVAVVAPLAALLLLPLPGNALARSIGLQGDLVAEAALLLGLPLARLFLGWIVPSPYSRLAADRSARLLAGAVLPLTFGVTALAQVRGVLTLNEASTFGQAPYHTDRGGAGRARVPRRVARAGGALAAARGRTAARNWSQARRPTSAGMIWPSCGSARRCNWSRARASSRWPLPRPCW